MKTITMYESDDGGLFRDLGACLKRDAEVAICRAVLSPLGDVRLEHNEYVQHDPAVVVAVRAAFVRAAPLKTANGYAEALRAIESGATLATSLIGRLLDAQPWDRAWGRLCCIDEQGREWNQPYFAINGNPNGRAITASEVS